MPTSHPRPRRRPHRPRFALTLHAHRRQLGLSQGELAARLQTSLQTYQRWEREERAPHPRLHRQLAAACGVPLSRVLIWFPPSSVVPPPESAFLHGLGSCLRQRRVEHRLSPGAVADRLGIAQERYAGVEAGQHEPTWVELVTLAAVFRCDLLALLPPETTS